MNFSRAFKDDAAPLGNSLENMKNHQQDADRHWRANDREQLHGEEYWVLQVSTEASFGFRFIAVTFLL